MKALTGLCLALTLSACGGEVDQGNSEAAIANKATALEEAANAAVAAQIQELENETNAALAPQEANNTAEDAAAGNRR
jgi:hypothetical protein